MRKICSRKNCNSVGEYRHTENRFYCPKHYRFYRMRGAAQRRKKYIPTWEECEILLYIWCWDFKCPICNIKLKWHSDINGTSNVISLQHNNDGTIMFICHGCNVGHGHSKLGDQYFDLKDNEKYCPKCNRILLKNKFYKSIKRKGGLRSNCRECVLLYQKERWTKRNLIYNADKVNKLWL